jgi:predicted anti-sigma-YlaC factor YlaD
MTEHWTDRLSEYVDGASPVEERLQVEAHLRECDACAQVVRELRAVAERASTLADRPPTQDLWPGIAARIEVPSTASVARRSEARARRRFAFTVPQLLAASIALIVLSAGGAQLVRQAGPQRVPVAVQSGGSELMQVALGSAAVQRYDHAVAELSQVLEAGRQRLEPNTVRILERNLQLIDAAIAEAMQAVADDPASAYYQAHLAETMQRKLAVMRQAAELLSVAS